MKKVLSLFLAILMMFSVLAVGSSAADDDPAAPEGPSYQGYTANADQALLVFKANTGTFSGALYVYNLQTNGFELRELTAEENKQPYVMVPRDAEECTLGKKVTLPSVTAPKGYKFDGWSCSDGNTYGAVPGGFEVKAEHVGKVVIFTAAYGVDAPEQDTFAKVFDILIKICGSIYGLLTGGDTEKGIATMRKLFAGLMD